MKARLFIHAGQNNLPDVRLFIHAGQNNPSLDLSQTKSSATSHEVLASSIMPHRHFFSQKTSHNNSNNNCCLFAFVSIMSLLAFLYSKILLVLVLLRLLLLLSCLSDAAATRENDEQQHRPNFVVMFGDNLGYTDIGYLAQQDVTTATTSTTTSRTPNIDQLARQGLHLEHWNSAAHLCSASRSALLTGRYPVRDGIYPGTFRTSAALGLSPQTPSIASILKQHGYATSMVGKWHLGHLPQFLPTRHGFEEWLGIPYHMSGGSLDGHVCSKDIHERLWLPLYHNETIIQQPVQLSQLAQRYANQAQTFIRQQAEQQQPFFLYLPFSHVHQLCAPRDFPEQDYCQWSADPNKTTFADAVQEMDWIAGQVMDALQQANVASNTLVLFTADNGPWVAEQSCSGKKGKFQGQWLMDHVSLNCTACPNLYHSSPTDDHPRRCVSTHNTSMELTGVPCGHDSGLGSVWEANLRMPAFAWWPGKIAPGRATRRTVSTLDVLPTLVSLAGIPALPQDDIDGMDISDILLNDRADSATHMPTCGGIGDNDDNDKRIGNTDRILFFWRDGFDDGPLEHPYGHLDVVAVKVGHKKFWFWTKSGHYHADPHVYHDPPLVFDIDVDPAEAHPIQVSEIIVQRVKELREEHIRTIQWGDPLTLTYDDAYIPCVDPTRNCRTDDA